MSHMRQWLTKTDFIFIICLLFVGIFLTLYVFLPESGEGNIVEVRANGKLLLTLPLDKDTEQTIQTDDGHKNHFIIRDKTVIMTSADCSDQTCVRTGKIHLAGQSIVCLPHRLVLTVKEQKKSSRSLDAVVQ